MNIIQAYLVGEMISSNSAEASSLHEKSSFGELKSGKIQYTLSETLYLIEKSKLEIFNSHGKKIPEKEIVKKFHKIDEKFQIKYSVFKDLREKGYVVKTALKFGADFRVYEKGSKPGDEHAKWIVFVDHESRKISWNEFSARNRVAHSTKKNLLLAIVDEEGDVTYYEVDWIKP